jgi:hypothetical protein
LPNPNFIHEVHAVAINHQMAVMQAQVGENCTRGCLPDRIFWRTKDGEEEDTHLFVEHEEDSEAKHIYIYIRELLINLSAIACSFRSRLWSSSGFEKSRENLDNICATIAGTFKILIICAQ